MNEGLRKLAEELLFSDWIGEEEREVVRAGYDQYKQFFRKNNPEALVQKERGNLKLFRLLGDTNHFLKFVGDPLNLYRLEGLEKMWREMGYPAIADGFKVRVDEAMYTEDAEPELPDVDVDLSGFSLEEDEAPYTQRSVAKILRYIETFYKMARG